MFSPYECVGEVGELGTAKRLVHSNNVYGLHGAEWQGSPGEERDGAFSPKETQSAEVDHHVKGSPGMVSAAS